MDFSAHYDRARRTWATRPIEIVVGRGKGLNLLVGQLVGCSQNDWSISIVAKAFEIRVGLRVAVGIKLPNTGF